MAKCSGIRTDGARCGAQAIRSTEGKDCTKCGEWKPLGGFERRSDVKSGRASHCKDCVKVRRQKTKAQKAEYDRRYRARNKEHIAKRLRRWYEENQKDHREGGYRWRKENPERFAVQSRLWRSSRRAKLRNAGGKFTTDEWLALCDAYGNVCLCCGKAKPLTVDHAIPLSKGGTNQITNVQPLCFSCNAKKGARSTDYREKGQAVG